MSKLTFISLDFETANASRSSACSVGLVFVRNGSIIKNTFYRSLIVDSLKFDFNNINWIFSDICCSISSGLLAAQGKNIDISFENIIQSKN